MSDNIKITSHLPLQPLPNTLLRKSSHFQTLFTLSTIAASQSHVSPHHQFQHSHPTLQIVAIRVGALENGTGVVSERLNTLNRAVTSPPVPAQDDATSSELLVPRIEALEGGLGVTSAAVRALEVQVSAQKAADDDDDGIIAERVGALERDLAETSARLETTSHLAAAAASATMLEAKAALFTPPKSAGGSGKAEPAPGEEGATAAAVAGEGMSDSPPSLRLRRSLKSAAAAAGESTSPSGNKTAGGDGDGGKDVGLSSASEAPPAAVSHTSASMASLEPKSSSPSGRCADRTL